ncbi:a6013d8d-adde-4589-860e-35df9af53099 [Sclerotinia trifoliorum]|uniref:A6013d8d-adde-4589-860e-35df9af53099 n=1 Tax=Sclerotinia trifoliorum TaxID=28548 RepID=A0A8H2ZXE9_9HELO|nr:a6013d8d-adde-4589-860e-35df9af53099 [Sclerotinia trifoliorum]
MLRSTIKMAETAAKRLKTSPVTIGTHNGHFHADEALAVYMLRLLPTYQPSELIRTRDPKILETCHTVVDVGGEYNNETKRYDHHQRTFDTTFPDRPTKLSSAGLVYMHYGKAIIAQRLGVSEDAEEVDIIWKKIYQSFIEALDAHDNGISVYDPKAISAAGLEKKFSDGSFSLGAMVGRLNPNWNDPAPSDPVEAQKAEDKKFLVASTRIGEEFSRDLDYYAKSWLPARAIVQQAYAKRLQYDPKGRILVFEGQSVPWKDHLYTIEDEESSENQILYVLYPENTAPDAKWRIQCVPASKDSFQSRKPLPEAWRGFRDEELSEITGIPGGVFVHAAGFIGGNKTFEGASKMAGAAVDL